MTIDEFITSLEKASGDTWHAPCTLQIVRTGDGMWTGHIQPFMYFMSSDGLPVNHEFFKAETPEIVVTDIVHWLNDNVSTITRVSGYHKGGTVTLEKPITFGSMKF